MFVPNLFTSDSLVFVVGAFVERFEGVVDVVGDFVDWFEGVVVDCVGDFPGLRSGRRCSCRI